IYNPTLSPSIPTQYIVNIENASGCNYTDTVFINVSNPIPTFDTILNPGCNGVYAEFVNTSNSEFGVTWNFSNGDYTTNNKVEKVFDFGSSFSATLTVQDSLNCTNSIDINIDTDLFENYFDIYYPNVFTPNSDGENDLFIVEVPGRINQCTELIIYNRFGEIQFISTGNNLKWDGRNNVGLELPNGKYFFTLNVKNGFFSQSGTLYKFQ
ncbi:MAG: gliding motility-associated C-terminal domain-containing protein, partial [Bacteroidota bacterium]|nr:gliding motility-associated C-terminal domain-containing protein [Bacteroidota bacterium]